MRTFPAWRSSKAAADGAATSADTAARARAALTTAKDPGADAEIHARASESAAALLDALTGGTP